MEAELYMIELRMEVGTRAPISKIDPIPAQLIALPESLFVVGR